MYVNGGRVLLTGGTGGTGAGGVVGRVLGGVRRGSREQGASGNQRQTCGEDSNGAEV